MTTPLAVLLPGFDGVVAPAWLRRAVADGLGGVVLFARNVRSAEQVAELVSALRAEREDLLVAIDEEGGDVTRLDHATGSSTPGNLALGAAGDPRLTEAVAAEIGDRLAELGIDLDLAPVADVNADPANPIVGVRAFGSDPALVADHTAAWVRGLQAQGVAACVKHFPGHGATRTDSHVEMPVLERVELAPFQAAITAGVLAVMPAHAVAPGYDDRPATLSRRLIAGLLRAELGFDGLVVSDGMDMRAIADRPSALGEALAAGVDALCLGGTARTEDDLREMETLLAVIPEGRLAQAGERLRRVAGWARAQRATRRPAPRGAGLKAARRALRVEGDVRVGPGAMVVKLDPPPSWAAGPVPWGLGEALALDEAASARPLVSNGKPLVIVVRDLHRHPWQQAVVAAHPGAVVVEMGTPVLRPAARGYIATFGAAVPNAAAAAEALAR